MHIFYSLTRINNELNDWFERHLKMFGHRNKESETLKGSKNTAAQLRNPNTNVNMEKTTHLKDVLKEKKAAALLLNKFDSYSDDTEYLSREKRLESAATTKSSNLKEDSNEKVYPISLYNTQLKQHENFMKSIRQRNDTFYYVSFRRVSYFLSQFLKTSVNL